MNCSEHFRRPVSVSLQITEFQRQKPADQFDPRAFGPRPRTSYRPMELTNHAPLAVAHCCENQSPLADTMVSARPTLPKNVGPDS